MRDATGVRQRKAAWQRWFGTFVVCVSLALGAGCDRGKGGQLPEAGGEAIKASRAPVEGFGVVRAWADQSGDALAVAVEFSRPLVGTQDFDALLTFAEPVGKDSSWSLDDGGTVLRFPFAEPNRTYTVRIAGALTAADGSTLGAAVEQAVFTGELEPAVGFASQGRYCRRAIRAACRWCRSTSRSRRRIPARAGGVAAAVLRPYQRGGRRGSWSWQRLRRREDAAVQLAERCTSTFRLAASATSAS